ncbi:hypothetical protein LY76DRAFT_228368 [Colletotrichum caudatum]|nr:hypothetical protein LY76DRAFT_228368 [Colletotrichum caudatum]
MFPLPTLAPLSLTNWLVSVPQSTDRAAASHTRRGDAASTHTHTHHTHTPLPTDRRALQTCFPYSLGNRVGLQEPVSAGREGKQSWPHERRPAGLVPVPINSPSTRGGSHSRSGGHSVSRTRLNRWDVCVCVVWICNTVWSVKKKLVFFELKNPLDFFLFFFPDRLISRLPSSFSTASKPCVCVC